MVQPHPCFLSPFLRVKCSLIHHDNCVSKHVMLVLLMLTKPRPLTAQASVGEIVKTPFKRPLTSLFIDDF